VTGELVPSLLNSEMGWNQEELHSGDAAEGSSCYAFGTVVPFDTVLGRHTCYQDPSGLGERFGETKKIIDNVSHLCTVFDSHPMIKYQVKFLMKYCLLLQKPWPLTE
jgi:hypothetical protein